MKVVDVVANLINFPSRFNSPGNVSIYNILKETGYFEMHDQVSDDIIYNALSQHPEHIDEWINYSQDKRTSSGWYFKEEGKDSYIVGYFGGTDSEKVQLRFTDRIAACAAFIKQESEAIRQAG